MAIPRLGPRQIATTLRGRPKIRRRIAAVIEGKGRGIRLPLAFFIRRRETDSLLLCELANGKRIMLPTSHKTMTPLVVVFKGEVAEVYTRDTWNRRGEKGKKEVFLVKENNMIYYIAKKIEKPDEIKQVKPEISEETQPRKGSAYIAAWWQCKAEEDPDSFETKVRSDGKIHLCSLQGIPMQLLIGFQYRGQPARVSFKKDNNSRWVIVELKRKTWEFWLVRDGIICRHPVPKDV